jgi:hypothetical protein
LKKRSLVLFQRDDCHLCDLALGVLAQAQAPEFESVFIDGDALLEERYGARGARFAGRGERRRTGMAVRREPAAGMAGPRLKARN